MDNCRKYDVAPTALETSHWRPKRLSACPVGGSPPRPISAYFAVKTFCLLFILLICRGLPAAAAVSISENADSFTLDNGIISAMVSKRTGDLISLTYKRLQMLDTDGGGASGGYWEYDPSRDRRVTSITIDPKTNGGKRGEVSVKGIFTPGAPGGRGNVAADIEIRYALGRHDSALYTYCTFSHPTNYPAISVGEARFCAKLNDAIFDWMTVDSNRNFRPITAYDWDHGTVMNFVEARRMNTGAFKGQVEHKYDYSANQFDTPAWGWSSSADHVGIWFINPSMEYLSGGPTKVELCAHRDCTFTDDQTAPAAPCLLNYWRSSHYGGSICNIGRGEAWTKVIGPFLIYCNATGSHDRLWRNALNRAAREAKAWPYSWVEGVDYPHRNERGIVDGRLVLNDSQFPEMQDSNVLVGLTAPDYVAPRVPFRFRNFNFIGEDDTNGDQNSVASNDEDGAPRTTSVAEARRRQSQNSFPRFGFPRGPQIVDWQNDARDYEFWARGRADGTFSIPNVRPGRYTLHAIADGVLGEYVLTNVTVTAGGTLRLGNLAWRPVRYGRQLWDIGIPNRTAEEFFKGDDYYHWGWYVQYPKLFPNDVNYVVGKSDFRKDWFFEQVPHDENLSDTNATGRGRATTWTITFDLPRAPAGAAILRLALCGVGARSLAVSVNDHPAGLVTNLVYNATINRDGIEGSWSEHDVSFDASLMKAGTNVLKLIIPAGGLTSGIMYDYLRLELNGSAPLLSKK
jgi:rhamnogalacturonan endolyase